MVRKIRLLLRENKWLRATARPFVIWLMNDVLKHKQRLIRKYGYDAVRLIHEAAHAVDMPYYADCGTLLGFVREKGFIAHDADMDFSMCPDSGRVRLFYAALRERGFEFERFILFDGGLRVFSVRFKEISIDFFQRYLSKDGKFLYVVADKKDDFWPVFSRPLPRNFKEVVIHGVAVRIPGNSEELLQSMYGDWRTPVVKWEDAMAPRYDRDYSSHESVVCRSMEDFERFLAENRL